MKKSYIGSAYDAGKRKSRRRRVTKAKGYICPYCKKEHLQVSPYCKKYPVKIKEKGKSAKGAGKDE